jgi:hypothetical protein
MVNFRDYQLKIIDKGYEIITRSCFLYLSMEVRTGKTLTSLGIAAKLNPENVLFLTKKKAISSISNDFALMGVDYDVINYESMHKLPKKKWDVVILDESHSCFLGNTLIDGVKIKDIKVGSFQKSFNFDKNCYEMKKVTNVFKNKLDEDLVKIKCNGKEIVCTKSHKIFTRRGWVKAGEILSTDELQVVRQEESIRFERLESVEVYKLKDKERIEQLCPDGYVYDIEVEGNHNYLAESILVHNCGAYPKPSKRAKDVKSLLTKHSPYVIMLSGTPTPESYSQMYHQVYGIKGNPFSGYKNFYRFCDDHVILSTRKIGGYNVNDYSNGKESILELMKPYMISFTQEQAGFSSRIDEEILTVNVSDEIKSICSRLKKDRIAYVGDEVILGDTGVKLMSKLHQLYSGTVKFESGNSMVLDTSKADYIKWKFTGNKVGIFYKFTAELEALKSVFNDDLTTDLDEFNSTDKHIALQIVSGREGISLKNADFIVFYNIDFSATSYWQARDRMTTIDRSYNKVYWIFSDKGIESKIHRTVLGKKNFTLNHFYND